MNIELDEVVVMDVSDDALEMAAGGAGGGLNASNPATFCCFFKRLNALADNP